MLAPNPIAERSRRGYTLMEIVLVLALLVAITALAMPAIRGLMAGQRLENAADIVRAEWGKARARAIKTGRIYVFRFAVNDGSYMVQPWFAEDDYLETSATAQPLAGRRPAQGAAAMTGGSTKWLPEGVLFVSSQTLQDTRSGEVEQGLGANGSSNTVARPVLFYPDGTTSTAQLILADERQNYIEISLRGLTGVATVREILPGGQPLQ